MKTAWIRRALRKRGDRRSAARLPHFNVTAPAERNAGLIRQGAAVNWQDEFESPEKAEQDPELRRLVDWLREFNDGEWYIVSRVHFGGASSHAAARELGIPVHIGERLRKAGLNRLRGWIVDPESAPKGEPPERERETVEQPPEPENAWETLDPSALGATMRGRYRGDGRRLDRYTPYETEGWTVKSLAPTASTPEYEE